MQATKDSCRFWTSHCNLKNSTNITDHNFLPNKSTAMHKMRTEQSPLLHLSHFYTTTVTTQTTFSHDAVNVIQQWTSEGLHQCKLEKSRGSWVLCVSCFSNAERQMWWPR